jgi:hypothetical protein
MPTEVKIMKLNNENYEVWRVLMEALLSKKDLHDVAFGHIPRPPGNQNAAISWDRKNREAKAEMILNVQIDQLAHMTDDNAADIWLELERVHRARGFATRITLRRKFLTMRMQAGQRMASWIGDVRNAAFLLSRTHVAVDDEDIILVLTMGLPAVYNPFVIALDATDAAALTLDYVITRLLNEETRILGLGLAPKIPAATSRQPANEAMAATESTGRRPLALITCFSCGNKGHYQRDCPSKSTSTATAAASIEELESDDEVEGVF